MKDYDTANNTDDNIPLQEDEDTAEVMRIAEELKRIQEEEDEEEGRGWDGSEAELVEDDDAEEYEIPMAGIRVSYVLTEEEYFKCLKHSGIYKSQGTRGLIEAVVLGILAVIFFVVFFMAGGVCSLFFWGVRKSVYQPDIYCSSSCCAKLTYEKYGKIYGRRKAYRGRNLS